MPIRPRRETGETCLSLREVVLCVHAHPPATQEEAARQSFSEHVEWGSPKGRESRQSQLGWGPPPWDQAPAPPLGPLWPCGSSPSDGEVLSSGKVWTHWCLMGGDLGLLNE